MGIPIGAPVGGIYAPVGFVRVFGVKGTVLIAGVGMGLLAGVIIYLGIRKAGVPSGAAASLAVLGGIAAGGFAAAMQYIQARGVVAGIPVAAR